MSVNRTSLGKRISFYRSKSNLTQEALAAKVNCSREYIVQIENGTKVPSLSVLVEIANTLSVSADELLLDCLEHSSSSANSEFHRLLLDCNETEQTVIIRMAKELKAALEIRKSPHVLVGRVDDVVRGEHVRPISASVNGCNVLMIKVIRTNSYYSSYAYICDTSLSVLQ